MTQWVSNGTDLFEDLGLSSTGTYVDYRIQPNQLYTGNKTGFIGVTQTVPAPVYSGPFDLNCLGAWGGAGAITYGNVVVDEFLFEIDPTTGKATSVQLAALRIDLERAA